MSQQTVLPIPETKTGPEVPVEKQAFPKIVPSPQVVIEIVGTSKKTFSQFVDMVVARWYALPRETKRVITLVGASVATSVTMTATAFVLARLVEKKLEVEAAK
jgi:hypothetical protein